MQDTIIIGFIEGIGGGELLLLAAIALMLFGSKNLPGMARTVGRTSEHMRRAVREVKDELMKAGDEAAKAVDPGAPPPRPAAHLQAPAGDKKDDADEPAPG